MNAAAAARIGRALTQVLRLVEMRTQQQWLELGRAQEAEAQRRQELQQQEQELERTGTRLSACQSAVAELRRHTYSPYDARGHRAAEERLAKAHFHQMGVVALARDRLEVAVQLRTQAHARWLRLRGRSQALQQMLDQHRKGQALQAERLQELVQDEDYALARPAAAEVQRAENRAVKRASKARNSTEPVSAKPPAR